MNLFPYAPQSAIGVEFFRLSTAAEEAGHSVVAQKFGVKSVFVAPNFDDCGRLNGACLRGEFERLSAQECSSLGWGGLFGQLLTGFLHPAVSARLLKVPKLDTYLEFASFFRVVQGDMDGFLSKPDQRFIAKWPTQSVAWAAYQCLSSPLGRRLLQRRTYRLINFFRAAERNCMAALGCEEPEVDAFAQERVLGSSRLLADTAAGFENLPSNPIWVWPDLRSEGVVQ